MIRVMATKASYEKQIKIAELGRVVMEGEIFDVTKERYGVLTGENRFGYVFVQKYDPTVKPEKTEEEKVEEPEVEVVEGEDLVVEDFQECEVKAEEKEPATKKSRKKKTIEG